jgi:hypothetical protein
VRLSPLKKRLQRPLVKGFDRPAIRKEAATGLRLVEQFERVFQQK